MEILLSATKRKVSEIAKSTWWRPNSWITKDTFRFLFLTLMLILMPLSLSISLWFFACFSAISFSLIDSVPHQSFYFICISFLFSSREKNIKTEIFFARRFPLKSCIFLSFGFSWTSLHYLALEFFVIKITGRQFFCVCEREREEGGICHHVVQGTHTFWEVESLSYQQVQSQSGFC